ncbi:unnamed protein product, partial [Pelagomonas calceolata]
SVYTCTYTQPKISRGERHHRAADAVAGGRGADGVRPGPPRGRPASPPSSTRRLAWTTTSLGPPNCHTEQWSLPPAHVHGQNRPLSRVSLSVERAFLNSQRARVARHNPPRVIGKPGSLPSLCLLGGHVLWPRLRLVPAAAAAVAAPAAAVATATSPVVVAPAAIVAAVAAAAATVPAAAAAVVVAAAAAAVAPAAVVVAA